MDMNGNTTSDNFRHFSPGRIEKKQHHGRTVTTQVKLSDLKLETDQSLELITVMFLAQDSHLFPFITPDFRLSLRHVQLFSFNVITLLSNPTVVNQYMNLSR
jgi:hypothetical protein